MTASTIEWTDHTVTPVIGCTKVSAGCRSCYAETLASSLARRFVNGQHRRYLQVLDGKRWNGRPYLDRAYMTRQTEGRSIPQRVRNPDGTWRPARIFNTSMGDVFHEGLTDGEVGEVWAWMAAQRWDEKRSEWRRGPTWIVVTKRIERAAELLPRLAAAQGQGAPVVHLLASVESQDVAGPRLDALVRCLPHVALVGVSAEPLLGPVDFRPWLDRIGWIIVGGESGKDPRPLHVPWTEDIVAQCRNAAVPVFVKQLGQRPVLGDGYHVLEHARRTWPGGDMAPVVHDDATGRVTAWLRDRKGGEMAEWPEALRIREWPP